MKGSARTLSLNEVVDAVHAAEDAFSILHQQDGEPQREAVSSAMAAVSEILDEHERAARAKLGKLWQQDDQRWTRAMVAVEAALSRTKEASEQPLRVISELQAIVQRLRAVPLEQLLEQVTRSLPALARELGRATPELDLRADQLLLLEPWGDVLQSAFVHVFGNALDHGIEPAEERMRAGKRREGRIALSVVRADAGVRILFWDDGRGLAVEHLRAKAG